MAKRKRKQLTLEQRYKAAADEFAKKVGPIVEIATVHGNFNLAQMVLSRITHVTRLVDQPLRWPNDDDPVNQPL